jgi:plastocyanin
VDTDTTSPDTHKHKKSGFFRSPLHLVILLLVLAGLIAVAATVYSQKVNDKAVQPAAVKQTGSSLSFSPSKQTIKTGETLTLSVWADSGDQEVNAVQAKVKYPTDKFDVVSISSEGSAFEVQAQSSHADGVIFIARAHVGRLKGKNLVATVELKAKEQAGTADISFNDDSHLVSASTNKDILGDKQTGTYTIEARQ